MDPNPLSYFTYKLSSAPEKEAVTHHSLCFQAPSSLKARNMETEGENGIETYCVYFLARTKQLCILSRPSISTDPRHQRGILIHASRPRCQRTTVGDDGPKAFAPHFNPRRRDGVAALRLSIFNCLLRMILHIQSSFPSPLIMDHAHLSCIVNTGTELEARYFIPPPLLTAVINAKACVPECRWQNKVNTLPPPCDLSSKTFVSKIWVFFRSRIAFVGLQTAHHPHCYC